MNYLENIKKYINQKRLYPHINKTSIDKKIKKHKEIGINTAPRKDHIVVSLTSFPEREYDIHYAIFSLLNQSIKPDAIILWLAESQFPNKEKDLNNNLLNLKKLGLTIQWCSDIKSYKKLLPTITKYPNSIIITADDDAYYHRHWLKRLYLSFLNDPLSIHCHRAHQITLDKNGTPQKYESWKRCLKGRNSSYKNWFTGVGGVLYPPQIFKEVEHILFDERLFKKLTPTADDTWFWAMALLQRIKITIVSQNISEIKSVNLERALGKTNEFKLSDINIYQDQNIKQIHNVISYFKLDKILNTNE